MTLLVSRRTSLCLVLTLLMALAVIRPTSAGAAERCRPQDNGMLTVDPPSLVDQHKVRAYSQVHFGCLPPDLHHMTFSMVLKQYQVLGFWSQKAHKSIEFNEPNHSITILWDCRGEGSQLYEVTGVIGFWYLDGTITGGIYAKESEHRRFSC
jgi:hypothetical protein